MPRQTVVCLCLTGRSCRSSSLPLIRIDDMDTISEPGVDWSSLIRKGLPAIQKYMKTAKSGLEKVDNYDQTILHVAAFEGDVEILTYLLKSCKPSDLKKRDKNGWTPLHAAASQGKLEQYDALLKKGASPNAQNGDLTSPFAYLCRSVL